MTETLAKQTLGFQAEIKQLLQLMVHSLYSNREIFLRELISNASDAADKLRFIALNDSQLLENDAELNIHISFDKDKKIVRIADNGIGMSRDEVVEHLGTIAKSGTAQFLQSLSGDQRNDTQLIGQFGVGFYSAFVVADRVEVFSRKAGLSVDQGVHWESTGEGDFTVETVEKNTRGTEVVLHLREDASEFADDWRLRSIIRKYSDHISLPILMEKQQWDAEAAEGDDKKSKKKKEKSASEQEVVNKATALWTRSRSDITDEEYQEFYKHIAHDFEMPLTWSHNKVEGKQEYTSLLYLPKRPPFDLYNREAPKGLKLYVQRVFIMDDAEQFLPLYLRFIKGVLDANDLPLNVSREILQGNKSVENMRSALVKRVLEMLSKLAKEEPEQYAEFWKSFGAVLKEGPGEDFANREKIASLLRFHSTAAESDQASVGLDQYLERMKPEQNKIYYLTADSYKAAINSPHLEVFRKKGIEVLLLCERIDEWMMTYLHEYQGKSFQHVAKDNLDLGDLEDESDKKAQKASEKSAKALVDRMKEVLKEQVQDVKVTHRLTDSPCCLVLGAHDMGHQMRQIMKAAGQVVPESKPILEINPQHPLVERLNDEIQQDRFDDLARILLDQAVLAEGSQLEDPNAYVQRINKLLLELAKASS